MNGKAEMPVPHGAVWQRTPGIRSVIAPNPGPMTHWGTNTFLIGADPCLIVDPGPENDDHLTAVMRALDGARVAAILVTHPHLDHSGGARRLAAMSDAPVMAFGGPEAGRRPSMRQLAAEGKIRGDAGLDVTFEPDISLCDGEKVSFGRAEVVALHTPGHAAGHLAFLLGDILISGDHAMAWGTSIISPPDGHLGDFLETTERLIGLAPRMLLPAHGATIDAPEAVLRALIEHRMARSAAILRAVRAGADRIGSIVESVYTDLGPGLVPAAGRTVLAHLIALEETGAVAADPSIGPDARWTAPG